MPAAPALADFEASVNGLIVGPGRAIEIVYFDGWTETPAIRGERPVRPNASGTFPGDEYADARSFPFGFEVAAAPGQTFDQVLANLDAALAPAHESEGMDVWYKLPTRVAMYARCKLQRRRTPVDTRYERGLAYFEGILRADDPLLYGSEVVGATLFPSPAGGLEFDLFTDGAGNSVGYLDFGEAGAAGKVTVDNQGSAEIAPVFSVSGPVPAEGFLIGELGGEGLLKFEAAVASGSVLSLDGNTGYVLLDGAADRSKWLTVRRWPTVPARSSRTFYFESLGSTTAAQMSVTSAPAWW